MAFLGSYPGLSMAVGEVFRSETSDHGRETSEFSVTKIFQIRASDRELFLLETLGGLQSNQNGAPYWRVPLRHDVFPYFYARNVRARSMGSVGGVEHLEMEVQFAPLEPRDYDPPEEGRSPIYITEETTNSVDLVPLPNRHFSWQEGPDSGAVVKDLPQKIRVPQDDIKVTIHQWPNAPNGSYFRARAGKINSAPFRYLWEEFDTGILLFENHTRHRELSPEGKVISFGITLNFKCRPSGWRKAMGRDGQFYLIKSNINDKFMYEEFNFNELLPQ